jgi:hypothetical protein
MDLVQLLGSVGWPGALAGAICFMFREYAGAQTSRITALEGLVGKLEDRASTCEQDRIKIRESLQEVREELRALRNL